MIIQEYFTNVFSYSAGVEAWVEENYPQQLNYTFSSDFAIADWYGEKDVRDTYKRVKESWLNDYKAFTEVVVSLNMLSWANDTLRKQGFDGREQFIRLYADLYRQATDDFYKKYGKNEEACDYFFQMTD